ncbi:MAG: hypothetical protein HUJ26_04470 [Planctomycetaceae bacterium]|nr:hypothetical protein [Planctomycetaceae bacterium]
MIAPRKKPSFSLGRVVATSGALDALETAGDNLSVFLSRHANGDWGLVSVEDAAMNDEALRHGDRVLSAYKTSLGTKLWIITEADRSATTVLLPSEY